MGGEHAGHPVITADVVRFIPAWAGNTGDGHGADCGPTVHPRVGGEHICGTTGALNARGSSPRGRGTRPSLLVRSERPRFIPAWAGNTIEIEAGPIDEAVHPRVGGEHTMATAGAMAGGGSSPRGRGTPVQHPAPLAARRFIPAWAGNASPARISMRSSPVHPRVGRERNGSQVGNWGVIGSSPRGRGTRAHRRQKTHGPRFIPAWAGNAQERGNAAIAPPVHPRVGGERSYFAIGGADVAGSSPRGRGTLHRHAKRVKHGRFIPAWAGNADAPRTIAPPMPVHPRVGGERDVDLLGVSRIGGSSPRGRGTPKPHACCRLDQRFIPAWAGNA